MVFTGPFFFQMAYEREIIRVLTEAGNEGLSVAKITRHVPQILSSKLSSSKMFIVLSHHGYRKTPNELTLFLRGWKEASIV